MFKCACVCIICAHDLYIPRDGADGETMQATHRERERERERVNKERYSYRQNRGRDRDESDIDRDRERENEQLEDPCQPL